MGRQLFDGLLILQDFAHKNVDLPRKKGTEYYAKKKCGPACGGDGQFVGILCKSAPCPHCQRDPGGNPDHRIVELYTLSFVAGILRRGHYYGGQRSERGITKKVE